MTVTPDRYVTFRYAGASGDFNPIHLDDEFARSVGLPGRILHGLWTMAQVARAQTEAAGGPHALKRLSVTFRGMGVPESIDIVLMDGNLSKLELLFEISDNLDRNVKRSVALALIKLTGAQWLDPAIALVVAASIVGTGAQLLLRASRVLVDESLPAEELAVIHEAVQELAPQGVVGYHELRTRRAGARRYVDMHVQFRAGTSLEEAHRMAHELQDLIGRRLGDADVLIHLEPQDKVRPGEEVRLSRRG